MVNVKLFDTLDDVEADAAGLLDRSAQPCLYSRLDWFRLLERFSPPKGRLKVARAEDGDRRAWLFLANGGRGADAYAAWYSLRVGLIGDGGLGKALARALRREKLAHLTLSPTADPAPLIAGLRAAGWIASAEPATGNWIAHTQGLRFGDYWQKRPGKLRSSTLR